MKVSQDGGIVIGRALLVTLSSLIVFLCGAWLSRSTPFLQSIVLMTLSACGSGFAALKE